MARLARFSLPAARPGFFRRRYIEIAMLPVEETPDPDEDEAATSFGELIAEMRDDDCRAARRFRPQPGAGDRDESERPVLDPRVEQMLLEEIEVRGAEDLRGAAHRKLEQRRAYSDIKGGNEER